MAQRVTVNLSLPPAYDRVLRDLAERDFGGNVSATVRALLDAHNGTDEPVTKSGDRAVGVATHRT